MSCNCFSGKPSFSLNITFDERLKASACHCNSRFVVEENHRRFCIECKNVSDVNKYMIDKWFDNSSQHRKCDYFFEYKKNGNKHPNVDTAIFVELKGVDIDDAAKQIDQTITTFKKGGYFRTATVKKVVAAIVFSHFPSNNSSYRAAVSKLRKNHGDLKVKVEHYAKSMTYDPNKV